MVDEQSKSSSQLLQELFSSFNTSYEEDADEDKAKKKRKKSKKAKKSKSRKSGSDGDDAGSEEVEDIKKKGHKKSRKDKLKNGTTSDDDNKRKRKRDNDDVDNLIQKHRSKVKNHFKGLVSNIGDIVIKNDELIKSKSRKREDELRKAAGLNDGDVEDGEILEEDNYLDGHGGRKHRKKVKLSASQAYKLGKIKS